MRYLQLGLLYLYGMLQTYVTPSLVTASYLKLGNADFRRLTNTSGPVSGTTLTLLVPGICEIWATREHFLIYVGNGRSLLLLVYYY